MKKLIGLLASSIIALLGYAVLAGAVGNNLIANPSLETANGSAPANWSTLKSGNNTTSFNYLTTGRTDNRSIQVQMTKHSGGQAEWVFAPVAVTGNTKYTFTDWYESNVQTHYHVMVTKSGGNTTDFADANLAASTTWKQGTISFTTPKNATSVTVYHYINSVGQLTTDDYDLEGPTVTAPTVSVSAPIANATVSGTQTVTATTTPGSYSVKNVQFQLDGVNLGSADKSAPYSVSWNTKNSAYGPHVLSAILTTTSGLVINSTGVTVNVNNATAPLVSISTPANNSTVSGTQTVTANASDAQGLTSVQFKLGSNNLGPAITGAPYTYNWDTTKDTDGTYTLTAVATNIDNLSTISTPVTVKVSNSTVTPPTGPQLGPNLISNPGVETSTGGAPNGWEQDGWGTNSPTYTYLNTGHSGTHSLQVTMKNYTTSSSGDADWSYDATPVTPGGTYLFSDWYESNTNTEIDAAVTLSNGTTEYDYIQTVLPASTWTQAVDEWDAPAGATSVTFFHLIEATGSLTTDDYSFQTYTPSPFNQGIVSVTIDDGYENDFVNALPILQQYDIQATHYIITAEQTNLDDMPNYMTNSQLQTLYDDGQEIASHTVTHPDLTTVSSSQLTQELQGSQTDLQGLLGVPVYDLAYPDGAYNQTVATAAAKYYSLIRGIEPGFNTRDHTNFLDIKAQSVDDDTTPAQVEAWVNEAKAEHTWLVLIYHEVANTPVYSDDALYTTTISDFNTEMSYIHSSGIAAESVQQAANEISPQL